MRVLLRVAAGLAALYVAFVGALYFGQRALQYPASTRLVLVAQTGLSGFEDLVVETADGERLRAYFRPPAQGRALVVYFHGNAGSLSQRAARAAMLAEGGRGVLLVSYRGYSGSTGSPTEAGLIEDARAAYRVAIAHAPAELVVLYGESLGTGVVVPIAAESPVCGVVLDAPFVSAAEVARMRYPIVPIELLMHDQFRTIDRIGAVEAPILVLHGARDPITPFAQGRALYEAAPDPKRFVGFESGGHSDLLEIGGIEAVRELLAAVEAGLGEAAFAAAAPR